MRSCFIWRLATVDGPTAFRVFSVILNSNGWRRFCCKPTGGRAIRRCCIMTHRVLSGILGLLVWCAFPRYAAAERINQEGRILGPLPIVTNAILFNTNSADAVVSNLQIFPVTNPWNEDISNRPVLSNSAAMIAQIVMDLHTNRAVLTPEFEMNYVLAPDNQPLVLDSIHDLSRGFRSERRDLPVWVVSDTDEYAD